jgi:gliding motility-associated lipoprotein GldJ
MKFNKSSLSLLFASLIVMIGASSCKKTKSSLTGWDYNSSKNGGFEVNTKYKGQATGPGLVLVTGGTFTMGNTEQDVMYDWNSIPRRVTVASFYMDETEVANIHYLEYLYWLTRVYSADYPLVVRGALPDTLVWRDELAYNEPYVENYLRHPAYQYYPVVGVSWLQANEFCKWRSDRVNEQILIEKGILNVNPNQFNEDNFNTESYLLGQYEGSVRKNVKDLNPNGSGERKVRFEDGMMLPSYRLPTEAEWEFAALGLIGNKTKKEERITDRRIYPWGSTTSRYSKHGAWHGDFLANFKRGNGDNMGIAGQMNDNANITAPVFTYMPNDYGLYNMSGNVNEWVLDNYRPMTSGDESDFNPYRGNVFKTKELDEDGIPTEKDSLGRIKYRDVTTEESMSRRNYKRGYNIDYLDGDSSSWVTYEYGVSTLINDKARVFKGGSWKDRAYYLAPGARRFLNEEMSTDDLGFRCAMIRVGSQGGNEMNDGKAFKKTKKAAKANGKSRKKNSSRKLN